MYVCMYVCMCVCVCVYVYLHIAALSLSLSLSLTHTHTHTHTQTHTHTPYINTYIYVQCRRSTSQKLFGHRMSRQKNGFDDHWDDNSLLRFPVASSLLRCLIAGCIHHPRTRSISIPASPELIHFPILRFQSRPCYLVEKERETACARARARARDRESEQASEREKVELLLSLLSSLKLLLERLFPV
jgi:hypothetical protein